MNIIDLSKYDVSYDIQFTKLMIKILQPFIMFKKYREDDPGGRPATRSDLLRRSGHRGLNIYRNKDQIFLTDNDYRAPHPWNDSGYIRRGPFTKEVGWEIISLEEYMHFIQLIFPRRIEIELNQTKEELAYEGVKKEILLNPKKTYPRFKIPMFIDVELNKANDIVRELNQLNKEGAKEALEQTQLNIDKLASKVSYLEEVKKINREKNGTIDNVIQFIKNLDYIELDTTEDQVFIQMPVRTIITLRS